MAIKKKNTILKRTVIVLLILLTAFFIYVEMANRNSRDMTYRQKVLKAFYPAWMWMTRVMGKNVKELSNENKMPVVSFYTLKGTLNNGDTLNFADLKGKKVLIVNTASDCGYTNQYRELQQLYEQHQDKLVVLAFPANDFREQEKGTDEDIVKFCKANFNISFPLMQKSIVIRSSQQGPVFRWLTDAAFNGWNDQSPAWNFSKYLVNEQGVLMNYFGSSVSPMSKDMLSAINEK